MNVELLNSKQIRRLLFDSLQGAKLLFFRPLLPHPEFVASLEGFVVSLTSFELSIGTTALQGFLLSSLVDRALLCVFVAVAVARVEFVPCSTPAQLQRRFSLLFSSLVLLLLTAVVQYSSRSHTTG